METWSALAYLVAAIFFILALRGLSSPASARAGLRFGVIGMIIAVATTLALPSVISFVPIAGAIAIGGFIGAVVALRIQMTALPQLVAAFHSLVGLAAVFVAAAAFTNPAAYGIGVPGAIATGSLVEMSLGTAIGAVTFTGSIIAFAKLQGLVSGSPVVFKGQHVLNAALGVILIAFIVWLVISNATVAFLLIVLLSLLLGILIIIPIGGADMPVVVSMLNSYSGWAACGIGFTSRTIC